MKQRNKIVRTEEILELMQLRAAALRKAITKAEGEEGKFPDGRLRVSANYSSNRQRYYIVTEDGDRFGHYIKKHDRALAKALAQKDYNQDFLKEARYELAKLEQSISLLSKQNADLAFQKLSVNRQILINPYLQTDESYIQEWLTKPFKTSTFMEEKKIYDTKKGEKVRSKSEAIIADSLYELGIPYHYEKALKLKSGVTRYPDFTLLKVSTGEEIYLEHFGLLDDEEYRSENLRKLEEYKRNGIYIGKNLLFTYETGSTPLDIKGIRQMLKEIM